MHKESLCYKKLDENKVQCQTCSHYCIIENGKYGFCGVRKNIDSVLFFIFYGQVIAQNSDPIEKKPLYHYLPGTDTLTIATVGCNFTCQWCQNWKISQITKSGERVDAIKMGFELSPERVIKDAILNHCLSISYSYTEPTIYLEYALDTMKLAHKKGLKNIWVSNGFMSPRTVELILPYLDAINIDLKSMDNEKYVSFTGGKVDPILQNIENIVNHKIHLELTTLLVPGFNDKKDDLIKVAQYIVSKLGPDIPWHLSQYHPAYKMTKNPIPIELFNDIKHIGHTLGLKNIYIGNI